MIPLLTLLAVAAASPPETYALVVGSNQAGPGQAPLTYATTDARRVAETLVELGGYTPDNLVLLMDPPAEALDAAFVDLEARLTARAQQDAPAVVLFYYSGHARASGLSLGDDELSLQALRARLEDMPATVRLVILDACQSGAITQPKGVTASADFSYSSLQQLTTEGTAVIASSAAEELSQESDRLRGGFFTHHLLTGLRGAADQNRDGRVSLGEAYQYTYHRTLYSTATTAVGSQHVTMESALRGQGEMILSQPALASAQLVLPDALEGELVVSHVASGTITAEIHKASGAPMRLAFVPGRYEILRGDAVCPHELSADSATVWDETQCHTVAPDTVTARHPHSYPIRFDVRVGTPYLRQTSAYEGRLEAASFARARVSPSVSVGLLFRSDRLISFHFSSGLWERQEWARTYSSTFIGDQVDRFEFEIAHWMPGVQIGQPVGRGWLVPYGQVNVGVGVAMTTYTDADARVREYAWGPLGAGAVGVEFRGRGRRLGLFVQGDAAYSDVLENLLGEDHTTVGVGLSIGIRGGL